MQQTLLGAIKVGVLTGTEGDATPFTDVTVANVSSTLHKIGFQKHGNEVMYSGHTGRMLNTGGGGGGGVGALNPRFPSSVLAVGLCVPYTTYTHFRNMILSAFVHLYMYGMYTT